MRNSGGAAGARFARDLAGIRRDWWLYAMVVPGILYYVIFCYAPMYGVTIAFKDYNLYKGVLASDWVGFQMFEKLFTNFQFSRALKNTVVISLAKLICGFPAPILFAIALNEVRNLKYKKLVQTIVCLPNFISWVILYGILFALFNTTSGVLKGILSGLGYQGKIPNLLTQKSTFRAFLVVTDIWKGFGYGSILYTATIATIDPQLYEAARIDGANLPRQIYHVTLPGLRPTIVICLIMNMGGILNAGFDQIFNLGNDLVNSVADILDTFVYRLGMQQMDFSLSTAAGLFKSGVGLVLVLLANKAAKLIDPESGLL